MPTNPRAITLLGVVLKRYIDGILASGFIPTVSPSGSCMCHVTIYAVCRVRSFGCSACWHAC